MGCNDGADALFVLDLGLDVVNSVRPSLSGEGEALLDGRDTGNDDQRTAQLRGETTTLPFLDLNLGLDVIDGVGGLELEGDCLSSEGLYENLHR